MLIRPLSLFLTSLLKIYVNVKLSQYTFPKDCVIFLDILRDEIIDLFFFGTMKFVPHLMMLHGSSGNELICFYKQEKQIR